MAATPLFSFVLRKGAQPGKHRSVWLTIRRNVRPFLDVTQMQDERLEDVEKKLGIELHHLEKDIAIKKENLRLL